MFKVNMKKCVILYREYYIFVLLLEYILVIRILRLKSLKF